MTVRDLIAILSPMNPDALVVLQKDAEGNGYSPLRDDGAYDDSVYIADSTWSGEVKYAELTDELEEAGYSEEDCAEPGEGVPCVVLVPIN
jgi:hypothetical protein